MEVSISTALCIAPYESIKRIIQKTSEEFPNLETTIFIGDLHTGVEIVKQNLYKHFDIIISRGGTASLIRKITNIPVVEIDVSFYDILRVIKVAENTHRQFAIVGFPNITHNAKLLCDLLHEEIPIITINGEDDAQKELGFLMNQGTTLVLGDRVTSNTARKLGLNSMLIESGHESVREAFMKASLLCSSHSKLIDRNMMLADVLRKENQKVILFDEKRNCIFSTLADGESLSEELIKMIPQISEQNTLKHFLSANNILYETSGLLIHGAEKKYYAFLLSPINIPQINSKYGITFYNRIDVEQEYNDSLFCLSEPDSNLMNKLSRAGQSMVPVILLGEKGTGKIDAARLIYIHGRLNNHPFIIIDCSLLNEKSWRYLINHEKSPIMDNDNTLLFLNLENLAAEQRLQLISIIHDTKLCSRNQVIFSFDQAGSIENSASKTIIRNLSNLFSCIIISLTPLREMVEKLDSICSMFIASLDVKLGLQVIGLESQALSYLKKYSWPGNYSQLRRVLTHLCVVSSNPYIGIPSAISIIKQEKILEHRVEANQNTYTDIGINLQRPLSEIIHDIVLLVLEQNRGNQTASAKQLGISRTTLWRYLNSK